MARLPSAKPARGRIVCSCLDVAETEILEAVARGAGVERLQSTLRCGTSCGSCVPELRRLAASQAVTTSGAPA
jgi:assimilatory nitrate reductase catalytic subunit